MPQVVIVSSLGPQGPVGPQGLQGLTGSMAESNSGSFAITGSLTVSGSSTFTNIGPAVFSGSSNFTSLTASSALISGDVTVLGTASINTLIVNQTQLSTGSNQLGDAADDTQTLYGTVVIPTGSLTVSGSTLTSGSLTVDGNIGLTGDIIQQDVNLDMKISGAQTGRAVRLVTSSTGLRLQALGSTTSNFTLSTTVSSSETARVTILEGGNVGIGTVTPSYTLDISGSLRVGTPTATPHLIFARASNNYITTPVGGALLFNLNNAAVENASIVGIYSTGLKIGTGFSSPSAVAHVRGTGATSATTALLVQNSNASASMVVLDNGNVGINTANPLEALDVTGNFNTTGFIYRTGITGKRLFLYTSGNNEILSLYDNSGTTKVELRTSGSSYFTSGNVGIGTTAPTANLVVSSGSAPTLKLENTANIGTTGWVGTTVGSLDFSTTDPTMPGTYARISTVGGSGSVGGGLEGDLVFSTAPSNAPSSIAERVRINSTGNVGIGTSSPNGKMTVVGNTVDIRNTTGSYGTGYALEISTNSNNPRIDWVDNGVYSGNITSISGRFYVTNTSNNALILGTNNTERMRITNVGNVGIGTTTPSASLHISGSSGSVLLEIDSNSQQNILYVSGSGNVGIGTNNPVFKLDVSNPTGYSAIGVQSAASNNAEIHFKNVAYPLPRWTIRATAVADGASGNLTFQRLSNTFPMTLTAGDNVLVGTLTDSARLVVKGSGTTSGTTTLLVQNANASSSLAILDDGSIGIGTTTPTAKLEIKATGSNETIQRWLDNEGKLLGDFSEFGDAGVLRIGYVISSISTNRPLITLDGGLSNTTAGIYLRSKSSTTNIRIASDIPSYISGSNLALGFINSTASAVLHISGAANDNVFRVDTPTVPYTLFVTGSGQVGIGIATPSSSLDIKGAGTTTGLALKTQNSAGVVGLTVLDKGWIGNKFNTPTALLQSDTFIDQQYADNGSKPTWLLTYNGVQVCNMFMGSGYEMNIANPSVGSNNGLYFLTGGLTTAFRRISILRDGNVGIGTSTPTSRLQVKGSGTTSTTNTFRLENSSALPSLIVTDDLNSRFFGNVGIGAAAASGSLHISASASTSSAAVYIYKSGSTTLDIQGSQGQLFSVTDALSGSLMSVNDISGLPILEVFSDDRVVMGSFSQPALLVTGSAVRFPATASATPTYTGSEGQVVFGVVGGNAFIYAWLGGRWRSGSLA